MVSKPSSYVHSCAKCNFPFAYGPGPRAWVLGPGPSTHAAHHPTTKEESYDKRGFLQQREILQEEKSPTTTQAPNMDVFIKKAAQVLGPGPGPWALAPPRTLRTILQLRRNPTIREASYNKGKSYKKRSLRLQHKLPTWMCL